MHSAVSFSTKCTATEGFRLKQDNCSTFLHALNVLCSEILAFEAFLFFTSLLCGCEFPVTVKIQWNSVSDCSGACNIRCGVGYNVGSYSSNAGWTTSYSV